MRRRRFITTAITGLALIVTLGCQSKAGQVKGKWEAIKEGGENSGSFLEFLGDGTAISSIPRFNVSSAHDYRIIEGDRLSMQSKKTNEVEIYSFRLDQGYLFLTKADSDREIKYKRI